MRKLTNAGILGLTLLSIAGGAWASPAPPASANDLAQLAANLRADVPTLNQIASVRAKYGANYRIPDATQTRFNSDAARSNDLGNAFQQWTSSLDSTATRAWYQCVGNLTGGPGNFQASLRSWIKADTSGFVESIAADAQNEADWWQTYARCLGVPQQAEAAAQQEQAREAAAQRQAQSQQQREQQQQLRQQQYQQRMAQIQAQRQQIQNSYQQRFNAIQQNQANLQNNINNTVAAVDAYLEQKQAEEEARRQEEQAEQDEQEQLRELREQEDELNQQAQSDSQTPSEPVMSAARPSGPSPEQIAQENYRTAMRLLMDCVSGKENQCQNAIDDLSIAANNQGNADAAYCLGLMYENGISVPIDYANAYGWYLGAASKHHAPAEFHLGHLAEVGKGMPADKNAAIKWYAKGSVDGSSDAKMALARLQP